LRTITARDVAAPITTLARVPGVYPDHAAALVLRLIGQEAFELAKDQECKRRRASPRRAFTRARMLVRFSTTTVVPGATPVRTRLETRDRSRVGPERPAREAAKMPLADSEPFGWRARRRRNARDPPRASAACPGSGIAGDAGRQRPRSTPISRPRPGRARPAARRRRAATSGPCGRSGPRWPLARRVALGVAGSVNGSSAAPHAREITCPIIPADLVGMHVVAGGQCADRGCPVLRPCF